ncbi:MAG: lysostaphin resistance A-like protein [Candidatus Rokuibacteriota bacterium]
MSDVTVLEPPLEVPRARRPPSLGGTLLAGLVLALFAGWMTWVHLTQPRIDAVAAPEEALALVVSRGMDLNEALRQAAPWERRLHQLISADGSDDLKQAIVWYEELAERSNDPQVDAHLAILYGEAGDTPRVEKLTATWTGRGGMLTILAPIINTAYLGAVDTDEDAERAGLRESLAEGWFADRLALAWAARVGDASLRSEASRSLETRARALLGRTRGLAVMNLALIATGVGALVAIWRRRRRPGALAVGRAALPPPWPGTLGVLVLIRGGAGAAFVMVALLVVSGLLGPWFDLNHPMLEAITWPLMYVPMLVLVRQYLLAPAGIGFTDALGLRLVPGAWPRLVMVGVALVAAGALLTTLITLGGSRLQLTSHWSEWFDEELAFGDAVAVAAGLAGAVALAPVFEEIVFRGILFATLRRGMGPGLAIVTSGVVFAFAHGYGTLGFVDVLWSGVLWAWAFEKTGSVLPGMMAHAVTNLMVSITVLALLR